MKSLFVSEKEKKKLIGFFEELSDLSEEFGIVITGKMNISFTEDKIREDYKGECDVSYNHAIGQYSGVDKETKEPIFPDLELKRVKLGNVD
ncbi:MAG: hypothetical protein AABY15_06515 [Nanoarchaeota archaeon]